MIAGSNKHQDEKGQWWHTFRSGVRTRCEVRACVNCGEQFVVVPSYLTACCSKRCGMQASFAGKIPGRPQRVTPRGPLSHQWKSGKTVDRHGYVYLHMPEHPSLKGTTRKTVREHRVVMERHLGRLLCPGETVHHKNGDRADNRIENLELWSSHHPGGQRVDDAPHCPTCTCRQHG